MATTIHLYRPQRTRPEYLEAIFVGRESLLREILGHLDRWRPGVSRHHYLIIGPRGIGKTYLLRLLEHRIHRDPDLKKKWRTVTYAEDFYGITKVSDLLVEALRILSEETDDANVRNVYDQVRYDEDEARVTDLSLDVFRRFHDKHHCGILLMVENVNRVFERQMRDKSQIHLLRKILIEEDWLVMICTSPTYLSAVTKPEEPLFEFFQVQLLRDLTPQEQREMLHKLASLEENTAFEDYLRKFQSCLQALYHFTGGNPRLTIMLYELVANQAITDVKTELDLLLDQLTPFYQDRMREISEQEGKLLEAMALMKEGCTPTELAKESRMAGKQVRALLTRLERSGYIRREERRRKRTIYIIPERFFRIWHQMNHSRAARGRVQYLLEFFSSWYSTKEERNQIWNELMKKFQCGLQEGDEDHVEDLAEYMKYVAAVSKGNERIEREFERLRHAASLSGVISIREELVNLDREYQTNGDYFVHKGYFLANDLGLHETALAAFQKAIELKQDDIILLFNEAVALDRLGRKHEARQGYERTASLLSRRKEIKATVETREVLLQILREAIDYHIVKIAAYILGRTADIDVTEDIIAILRSSRKSWRRQYCATTLGLLKAQMAVPILVECLQDEAKNVRGSAAIALGRIASTQAVGPLLKCLRDKVSNVRGSAAIALGRIASTQAVDPLIERLKDEKSYVRGSAAAALGHIGSKKAIRPLIECLKDVGNNVRADAAMALGRIGSKKAMDPLIECLMDEDHYVRSSAAISLGRIGLKQAMKPLIERLRDEDKFSRASAATALGFIGSEKTVRPLIECLNDEASIIRASAATALGRIGSELAEGPLIESLRDEDSVTRGSAATALGYIGSQQAVGPLIERLQDEANNVRCSAAAALGRIGSEQAIRPLIDRLRDKADNIRASAATALGRIASEKPTPDLPQVIGALIEELANEPRAWAESAVRTLLRSAFRSGNLEMASDAIEAMIAHLTDAEALCAPHMAALEYLRSNRDPAVIERQHPEMREAIQLLVDVFDEGHVEGQL